MNIFVVDRNPELAAQDLNNGYAAKGAKARPRREFNLFQGKGNK